MTDTSPTPADRPADQLRAAAELLRETATVAGGEAWTADHFPEGTIVRPAANTYSLFRLAAHGNRAAGTPCVTPQVGAHMALLHPGVGLAVSRWLESWAGVDLSEHGPMPEDAQHALAVARQLLGTTVCGPVPDFCGDESCANHEREQAHAEGEHAFCGPECAAELTADEAREMADDLNTELYQARDALAFVGECCDIADREQRPVTTGNVREWLKGARCGRQLLGTSAAEAADDTVHACPGRWAGPRCRCFDSEHDTAAPPAPADRAAEVEDLRAELDKLIRWHKEDGAQAVKAATTITRLRAERAELSRQLECIRGDMRDMESCLREQDAEFERIRRAAGEAAPAPLAARLGALAAEWEKRGEYGDSSITDRARELRAVLADDAAAGVQPPTTSKAHPAEHAWAAELHDPLANEWVPGTRYAVRDRAVNALEHGRKVAPLWKDGTPTERRLVRATTTYTVEPTEPTEPPTHLPKGTNAEDCPACKGTNPDYPFLCPGPPAAPAVPEETQ